MAFSSFLVVTADFIHCFSAVLHTNAELCFCVVGVFPKQGTELQDKDTRTCKSSRLETKWFLTAQSDFFLPLTSGDVPISLHLLPTFEHNGESA